MGLNSRGEVLSLTDSNFYATYTRHTRRYLEDQPELAVRHLQDGGDAGGDPTVSPGR